MKLSPTEFWDIAAQILHDNSYKKRYIAILGKLIGNKNNSVLDTACGTGFPSIDLYIGGFHNLTCMDASKNELILFKKRLQLNKINIKVIQGQWQNITKYTKSKYDVLLNIDSALGYMDSWLDDELQASGQAIFDRLSLVLKNFYKLLNDNGLLIVAIPQNNIKTNTSVIRGIGQGKYNGKHVEVRWLLSFDWDARVKTWKNELTIDGKKSERVLKSYLFTKVELKELMENVGFKKVKMLSKEELYDDFIIGYK